MQADSGQLPTVSESQGKKAVKLKCILQMWMYKLPDISLGSH